MTLALTDFANHLAITTVSLTPRAALGIPIALIGSVFLAVGAQLQHRGVVKVESRGSNGATSALSISQLLRLLGRPSWVLGSLLLGLAVVFQLTSLYLAPITVVQPLGALALVITALVNSRVSRVKLTRRTLRSILFCIVGVALFVTIATFTTTSRPISQSQLITVLLLLLAITIVFSLAFALFRSNFKAIIYIVGAGVLYGFVATLAKVVIDRIQTIFMNGPSGFEGLTILCVVALLAATVLGGYFVQTAYSSGPPDLVIAGLTVIDPIVAVTIGIVVLNEAANAPWFAYIAFVIAAGLAIYGVFQLAKYHPQAQH